MNNNGVRLTIQKKKNPIVIANKVAQKVKNRKCITDSHSDQLSELVITDSDITVFDAKEWQVGSLKMLVFRNNPALQRVTGFEHMPHLKMLTIINSENLQKIDDSILTCAYMKMIVLHGSIKNKKDILTILNGAITTLRPGITVISKCIKTHEFTKMYYDTLKANTFKYAECIRPLYDIKQYYDNFIDDFVSNMPLSQN